MMLSNAITVARRFQRSARIDTDLGATGALEGFVCHGSNKMALETMARLIVDSGQRAFTWTGPYGGGKSSLALALCASISRDARLRKRAKAHLDAVPWLGDAFPAAKDGWLVVPAVGRRSDPVKDLRQAVAASIAAEPGRARTRRRKADKSGRDVIERLHAEAQARPKAGVLLVIDEMGKFLEGARAEETDIHFFQDLAEAAARSKGRLIVLGILHQAFEQYATRLGREAQDEWAKVQGRYVDIPIVTAIDEVIDLVGRAIICDIEHVQSQAVAADVSSAIARRRPGSPDDLGDRLDACWPLHPVTAALLGPVSRGRFGQNERSVFGFLGSSEPQGFQEFLRETPAAAGGVYDPSRLWDYLRLNLEPAILASPDGHRWAQGAEAVERCEAKGTPLHIRLAKTIAVIDLFRNGSGAMAEQAILRACLNDVSESQVDRALDDLAEWSIAIFRKHLDAWSLYAGSDFDINEAVEAARVATSDVNLGRMNRLANTDPLLAKQHYHRTGTLRWFETELIALSETREAVSAFEPLEGSAGKFLLAIPAGEESERKAKGMCRRASQLSGDYPVAVGLPRNAWLIRELGAELIALETVRKSRPELEGDAVARREITARIAATSAQLEQELRAAFGEATWYVRGQAQGGLDERSLSRLVSRLADDTFSQAPIIHSELINREKPSSNSQAAVRQLLYAMVTHPDQEHLGIEGYKAERGLYSTVLGAASLHGGSKGAFGFTATGTDDVAASFRSMWRKAEELLEAAEGPLPLSALYEMWTAPPFGIRRGLLPILAMAFIQAHRSSVAVYAEDMFQPEMNDFVADQLLQDEELIKLREVDLQGQNEQILRDVAKAIGAISGETPEIEPLALARSLVRFVFELPPWTRRTLSLSKQAQGVRRVLLHASDPHQALFVDLPLVFDGVSPKQVGKRIGMALRELDRAYPAMLDGLRERMLSSLAHKKGDWRQLQKRAKTVAGLTGDLRLDAFAMRLSKFVGEGEDMESLAGLAVNKPPRDWSDREPDQAALVLAELALRFRRAETLARVKDREPTRHALAVVFGTGEDGRTVMQSFDVGETEEAEVRELAEQVLRGLQGSGVEQHLLLAVLAEAGARVIEDDAGRTLREAVAS